MALLSAPALQAQTTPPPDPKAVPVIDGAIGPCSADFTVSDNTGAPIYDATIQVHVAYGFLSAYKLDLQVGTNADGKARFTGLPAKTKRGLFFSASKGSREASVFYDPAKTCKAQFTVVLEEKKPTAQLRARSQAFSFDPEVLDHRSTLPSNLLWRMRSPSPMIIPISMRRET
ncbi:MAG: carboxypeptidase-like regulatory domain-containing protein [Candidatus Sulfotelmatobacter sp.]